MPQELEADLNLPSVGINPSKFEGISAHVNPEELSEWRKEAKALRKVLILQGGVVPKSTPVLYKTPIGDEKFKAKNRAFNFEKYAD